MLENVKRTGGVPVIVDDAWGKPVDPQKVRDAFKANPDAKVLHYTLGGPWFKDTRDCDHAADWLTEYRAMTGQDYWPAQVWECPPLETPA